MKFELYIDKKYTASGIRIYVKLVSDTSMQSDIFLCRIENRLIQTRSSDIPVFIGGNKSLFSGPTKITKIQDIGVYEATATPNVAIGAGSTYKHATPNIIVLKDITVSQDMLNGSISFPTYASDMPLWADLKVPWTYSGSLYSNMMTSGEIKIKDILDGNRIVVDKPLPTNCPTDINCIISRGNDQWNSKCYVQSSYSGTSVLIRPNPYEIVVMNSFIEIVSNSVEALNFTKSIKASVKSYIDTLKSIGLIDGVETVYYET